MIGHFLLQELQVLNKSKYKPVLDEITDVDGKINFKFSVKDSEPIVLTHKDTDILKHERKLDSIANMPRNMLVSELYKIVKSEFKTKQELNFEMPLSENALMSVKELSHQYLTSGMMSLIDNEFILDAWPPVIAYNIMKLIVEDCKKNNKSNSLWEAYIANPSRFFDPDEITRAYNIETFQDSGFIRGL